MSVKDVIKKVEEKLDEVKDPVCGMKINLNEAQFQSTYQGEVYGFCSAECKATFDKNPFKYADANC
jgi:Cu+-exporting ATPase